MTTLATRPIDTAYAAIHVDGKRGRSVQKTMGASNIGPCIRQGAYYFHQVEPTNPQEGTMPAILGTWIHKGVQEALLEVYGTIPETLVVHPGGHLSGHIDGITLSDETRRRITRSENRPRVAGYDVTTVEDLKTRADDRLIDQVRSYGPPAKEKRQVYTYVWLLSEFGAEVDPAQPRKGMQRALRALGPIKPDRIRLRYLARDRGEEYIYEEDVDPAMVQEARERYEYVLASKDPESVPREQDGPGLSYVCDSCPFLTACWGAVAPDDDGVWPQHIRIVEGSTTVEEELAAYLEAMRVIKPAEERKALARATLSGEEAAQYGAAGKLGWSGGKPRPPVRDADAAFALLEKAGVPIPMKTQGPSSRAISVRPV